MKLLRNLVVLNIMLLPVLLQAQANTQELQVAFLADVHFQDLYGNLSDSDYKGIVNPDNGKPVLLRTMESQLHSTRIFNENYFAFLAALDDMVKRGIHYVALPGDYTDDGQPIHLRGLQKILYRYSHDYGMEFFITTGNHDPVGPFAQPAGKDDFLGESGKRQPIFSNENLHKPHGDELPVVISGDIAKMGYDDITTYLKDFGFFPKQNYKYWATPFSSYSTAGYSYSEALLQSKLQNRVYDVASGYTVPDISYLVEPVEGLWLLAIDGNVYIPKANNDGDAKNPKNYSGADIGYNNVLSHKKHLIAWVKKVAEEAKKQGKLLIAFSHYPMVEFNDDASDEIALLMGKGKWQLDRLPVEEVAQTFADAGITIHFGGHMHINDTGIRKTTSGNTIVNIQTPSLAAYIPAYKLLTLKNNRAEIETITIDEVRDFDSLFALYKMEHDYLEESKSKDIWDDAILKTKSYREFTDHHLKELVRLRFLPDDWPTTFKDMFLDISGYDLLLLANRDVNTTSKIKKLLKENRLSVSDFKEWKGIDMIIDFYRLRSADRLAIKYIGDKRIRQYELVSECFFKNNGINKAEDPNIKNLDLFFTIFNKFLNGAPAGHFTIDLKTGGIKNIDK
jgi:hypothetical protein